MATASEVLYINSNIWVVEKDQENEFLHGNKFPLFQCFTSWLG